jgi:hypothetical protein
VSHESPPRHAGAPDPADPPAGAPRDALSGDLASFGLAELLQLLHLAQATGRLELERPGERAELFLEDGRLLHARTDGRSVRTGELLEHRGVSPAAIEAALAGQSASGGRLGERLIAAGATTPEAVSRAVHDGVRRVVFGLLMWRAGRFRFAAGERWETRGLELDLELDRLVLEGYRIADEAAAIA